MRVNQLKLLFIVLFCVAKLCANAQSSLIIGAGPVFPLHATNNGYPSDADYRNGGSFSAMFELPVIDHLKFTFSAGYQFYIPISKVYNAGVYNICPMCAVPQEFTTGNKAYDFIPLIVGLRDYFTKYLYINLEAGEAIKTGGETINSFIYGGGFGGYIPFDKHNALDLTTGVERGFKSVDYDYAVSQLYIKLAYKHRF